jgi:alpha,alpha-trehalose phosphorylase
VAAAIADASSRYVAATGDADFEERPGTERPDEYTAVIDDVYTNVMAQPKLGEAGASAERLPAAAVVPPYDEMLGVQSQSEGFTQHAE